MAARMEKTRTPGVYTRGSRHVYVVYVNGKQRKRSARTYTEAKRLRAEWIARINRQGDIEESRASFREYAEQWIERYRGNGKRGFSPETRVEYRRDLAAYVFPFFDEHLGGRLVTKITPKDVSDFVVWMDDEHLQGRRRAMAARTKLEAELAALPDADRHRKRRERVEARLRALRFAIQSAPDAHAKVERLEAELAKLAEDSGAAARRRRAEIKRELPTLREALRAVTPAPLAPGSIRRILAPLRACFATAREENLIHQNPVDRVRIPVREEPVEEALGTEVDRSKVKALSREQLRAFLTIVHPHHQLMFRFLAATGLRWSELIALRWGDLQLDGSSAHVRVRRANVKGRIKSPKSKYGKRDVPVEADLVSALRGRRSQAEFGGDQDLVFPSSVGTPLDYSGTLRRVLRPAAAEAGAGWAAFHTFRHTCASLLFARGASIVQVQRWLGHHSPAFTMDVYVHLLPGDEAAPLALGDELGVATKVATQATPSDRSPVMQDDGLARLSDARRAEATESQR